MDLSQLTRQFDTELAAAADETGIRALRDKYLARRGGVVSNLLKDVASAPADVRPALGREANALKVRIQDAITAKLEAVGRTRPAVEGVDVTLPGREPLLGHRHPLTVLRDHLESIFLRLGFLIVEGPELEDDYHNFEALNMPLREEA